MLHITDTGVGMTKDEMIKNLGTIARSGTNEFFQKLSESSANEVILRAWFSFLHNLLLTTSVSVDPAKKMHADKTDFSE